MSAADDLDAYFSDFYLRIYAHSDPADDAAEALAAARLAKAAPEHEVLDVGCGFGRHCVPLAEAGYRVTGVDRSQTLLDEARRRAGSQRWPKFARADYRELPFADDRFDAALNLFSLGYQEDANVLAETRRVLKPGGRLVLETRHRDLLVRTWQDNDWRLVGEGRLLLERRTFDPVEGVTQTIQTLIEAGGERESRPTTARIYTASELVALLRAAGFDEVKCWGGYEHEPFTPDSRLVVVATA